MSDATDRDPELEQEFRNVLEGGGAAWRPPADPTAEPGKKPDPRKALVFDIVAKYGPAGIGPAAVQDSIKQLHPDLEAPHTTVIGRWLDADPRIHKPAYGRYAVRPEQDGA